MDASYPYVWLQNLLEMFQNFELVDLIIKTHRPGHMRIQYHMFQTVSHSEAFQRLSQMFFTLWPLLVTSAGHKQKCTLALHSSISYFLMLVSKGMMPHAALGTHNSKHLAKLQDHIAQHGNTQKFVCQQ